MRFGNPGLNQLFQITISVPQKDKPNYTLVFFVETYCLNEQRVTFHDSRGFLKDFPSAWCGIEQIKGNTVEK